jgi:hypothetical protein
MHHSPDIRQGDHPGASEPVRAADYHPAVSASVAEFVTKEALRAAADIPAAAAIPPGAMPGLVDTVAIDGSTGRGDTDAMQVVGAVVSSAEAGSTVGESHGAGVDHAIPKEDLVTRAAAERQGDNNIAALSEAPQATDVPTARAAALTAIAAAQAPLARDTVVTDTAHESHDHAAAILPGQAVSDTTPPADMPEEPAGGRDMRLGPTDSSDSAGAADHTSVPEGAAPEVAPGGEGGNGTDDGYEAVGGQEGDGERRFGSFREFLETLPEVPDWTEARTALLDAAEKAPHVYSTPLTLGETTADPINEAHERIRVAADDALITYHGSPFMPEPNAVYAKTSEGLRRLYVMANTLGLYDPTHGDPDVDVNEEMNKNVAHEMDHLTAHTQASSPGLWVCGIRLHPDEVGWGTQPFIAGIGTLSKLELAAISIFPEEPSASDRDFIRSALGYQDESDVVARIKAHNENYEHKILLPKWYRED